jgi:hypothetical protein
MTNNVGINMDKPRRNKTVEEQGLLNQFRSTTGVERAIAEAKLVAIAKSTCRRVSERFLGETHGSSYIDDIVSNVISSIYVFMKSDTPLNKSFSGLVSFRTKQNIKKILSAAANKRLTTCNDKLPPINDTITNTVQMSQAVMLDSIYDLPSTMGNPEDIVAAKEEIEAIEMVHFTPKERTAFYAEFGDTDVASKHEKNDEHISDAHRQSLHMARIRIKKELPTILSRLAKAGRFRNHTPFGQICIGINQENEVAVLALAKKHISVTAFKISAGRLIAIMNDRCEVYIGDIEESLIRILSNNDELLFATIFGNSNNGRLIGESIVPLLIT